MWKFLENLFKKEEPSTWRALSDLPPQSQDEFEEYEIRCAVTWEDIENPPDVGMDITSLAQIREGDFDNPRYGNVHWRSLMDCPAASNPQFRSDEDDY